MPTQDAQILTHLDLSGIYLHLPKILRELPSNTSAYRFMGYLPGDYGAEQVAEILPKFQNITSLIFQCKNLLTHRLIVISF